MTPSTLSLRVALLIPSYNSHSTIVETLSSVRQQAGLTELLSAVYLADDCSRDDTVALAQATWTSPVPLHVLTAPRNRGERGNVNDALAAIGSAADWVLLLHADDLVKSHWLQAMTARMRACPAEVATICSSWDDLCPDGSIRPGEDNVARPVELILGEPAAVRGTLLRGCWWHLSGCALRTAAFREIGGFALDMPQLGDWEWLLRCLARGWAVEYVPRTLLIYRQHTGSVSSASFLTDRDIRETLRIIDQYRSYLTRRALNKLHMQMQMLLLRRIVRAVFRLSPRRCLLAFKTVLLVARNWLASLPRRDRTGWRPCDPIDDSCGIAK